MSKKNNPEYQHAVYLTKEENQNEKIKKSCQKRRKF